MKGFVPPDLFSREAKIPMPSLCSQNALTLAAFRPNHAFIDLTALSILGFIFFNRLQFCFLNSIFDGCNYLIHLPVKTSIETSVHCLKNQCNLLGFLITTIFISSNVLVNGTVGDYNKLSPGFCSFADNNFWIKVI